jgi:hypothetical protein
MRQLMGLGSPDHVPTASFRRVTQGTRWQNITEEVVNGRTGYGRPKNWKLQLLLKDGAESKAERRCLGMGNAARSRLEL